MQVGTCDASRRTQLPTVRSIFALGGVTVACTVGMQRFFRQWRYRPRHHPTGDRPHRECGQPHTCFARGTSTADESGMDLLENGDLRTMPTAHEGDDMFSVESATMALT